MSKVRRIKTSVRLSRALTGGSTVRLAGQDLVWRAWVSRDKLTARADQERAGRLPD